MSLPSKPVPSSAFSSSDSQHSCPDTHHTPHSCTNVPSTRPPYAQGNSHSPVHPPLDRDSYHRTPHSGDPLYYPQKHPYGPPPHAHPEYRPLHQHLPPPPHPPAPPAPPRPQQYREAYGSHGRSSPSLHQSLVPTQIGYYRAHAEYNTQHALPRPNPVLESLAATPFYGNDKQRAVVLRADEGDCSRSEGAGSGCGSGVHGEQEQEQETTPSPVDPDRIQRWEDEHAHVPSSQYTSSGSGSYGEDADADEENHGDEETIPIDPSLRVVSRVSRSPSQGQEYNGRDERRAHDAAEENAGTGGIELHSGSASLEMPNSQKRPNSEYYPSSHHQAQFAVLAQQTGPVNTQRGLYGLNSLVDGEPGDRPAYPIPTIIKCAILGSPRQQLTLSELYQAMEMRFEYYKTSDPKSWRNSVRHNLSLNNQFDKKPRPITEPGKGNYWVVVPDRPQGNKRERKRNKKPGKRALAAMAAQAEHLASRKIDEQGGSPSPTAVSSPKTTSRIPIDPQLTSTTAVFPAALRGSTGTLPANVGSYAAVTGALPAPAPLNKQLYRPWGGSGPPSSTTLRMSASTVTLGSSLRGHHHSEASRPVGSAASGDTELAPHATSVHKRSPAPTTQPQLGEASPHPAFFGSPTRNHVVPTPLSRKSGSGSTEGSSSARGPVRSYSMRARRRYDPTAAPPGPQNGFAALAAQIEREGTGATGTGGPGLSAREKRDKGSNRRIHEDESESEEDDLPSGDDEYRPSQKRRR